MSLRAVIARVFCLAILVAHFSATSAAWGKPQILGCQLGFDGDHKLGKWAPVRVQTDGAADLTVDVVAPDSDGVAVTYPLTSLENGAGELAQGVIRVGRRDAPLTVRLRDGQGTVASRTFSASDNSTNDAIRGGLSPTDRLVVELTASTDSVAAAIPSDDRPTRVAVIDQADLLPLVPAGYESVDALVISLTSATNLTERLPDARQADALVKWVEAGGRLILVGAAGAKQAFAAESPLSKLAPGVFDEVVTLTDPTPIERYINADQPIGGGRRVAIPVARLANVRGRIEVYAGGKATDLPIVIRQRRGFGEVVFLAIDPSAGPLTEWKGKADFLARASGITNETTGLRADQPSGALVTSGYTDLSGALQQRLGARFSGVTTTPMLAIVAAAVVYLLLLGPVDYFLLERGIGRFGAAWITLPVILFLFGGGAYWLSHRLAGQEPRVNQIELVDHDLPSGVVRGTLWAQAYSPAATKQQVSLAPRWPDGTPVADARTEVTWLGLPGRGLGGLERSAGAGIAHDARYQQVANLSAVRGLPINVRSTKSLIASWHARTDPGGANAIDATLASPGAGVLEGLLVNNTRAKLEECWLGYGDWAWRLGTIADGAAVAPEEARAPIKLKTLVRRDYLSDNNEIGVRPTDRVPTVEIQDLDLDALLHLMMFTEALGGPAFTGLPNHFQGFTDLSTALDQGRAVLVARVAPQEGKRGSELLRNGDAWAEPTAIDRAYYRFVLEVESEP
ncbi:MAG: hypothetical protein AAGF31_10215 [Planctomycetota bacterium]